MTALSSCISNEDIYDPTRAEELKFAQYEAAFIKKYGKISTNQNWGFEEFSMTRNIIKPDQPEIKNVQPPAIITEEERIKVTNWFEEHKGLESININWTDFTIQHVNSSQWGTNMDYLYAGEEHVNDFNSASGESWRLIQNGQSVFSYHNSMDSQTHKKYTIQCIDGSYYVGFDFEAKGQNSNQQVSADGIYNDWILKICPADYTNARRIMAEDLAKNAGDFDFNDVVFDAVILDASNTVITLRAAGGTIPLCIGDAEHEVHTLFGVSQTTMVNTHAGKKYTKAPVVFRLGGYKNLKDIPVIVNGITIRANIGEAPAKLCCPTKYEWSDEMQSIEDKFQNFGNAVINGSIWYETGDELNWNR